MKNKFILFLVFLIALALGKAIKTMAESPTTWSLGASPNFEGTPAGTDLVSSGDDKIRELKSTIRNYAESEICWGSTSSTGCTTGNDGQLRAGACRAFFETTAPTTLKLANRTNNNLDAGRLWADSDSSPVNHLQVYDSAWEDVDGVPGGDRTNWEATRTSLNTHLLAVKATTNATRDTSGANCATPVAVIWNTESFDDSTMHDTVTNNTRLTTPSGSTRVRLQAYIHTGTDSSTSLRMPWSIRQDGAGTGVATVTALNGNLNGQSFITIDTGPVTVTGGTTYFEVIPGITGTCTNADGGAEIVQTDSYFTMEVIK